MSMPTLEGLLAKEKNVNPKGEKLDTLIRDIQVRIFSHAECGCFRKSPFPTGIEIQQKLILNMSFNIVLNSFWEASNSGLLLL